MVMRPAALTLTVFLMAFALPAVAQDAVADHQVLGFFDVDRGGIVRVVLRIAGVIVRMKSISPPHSGQTALCEPRRS